MSEPLKLVISAGELSGDQHAADVVAALRELRPQLEVRGMGGRALREQGVDTVVDSESSAGVMGFSEVFGKLGKLWGAFKRMKELLQAFRPNALVLVDFPDFNLRLARVARRLGIPVLYYIPPKLWAWRESRVRAIRRYVDQLIVIFPFEKEFYEKHGIRNVKFVGNPLLDQIKPRPVGPEFEARRATFCSELGLNSAAPLVALLPGSRSFELERHLRPILLGVEQLRKEHPEVQAVLALPRTVEPSQVEALMPPSTREAAWLRIVQGRAHEVLSLADVGIIKSGTSTLEAALAGLPHVMVYKASQVSATIVKSVVKLKQFSLVNIVRPGTTSELTQEEFNPERVAGLTKVLLFDAERRAAMVSALQEVRVALAAPSRSGSCAQRCAEIVVNTVENPPPRYSLTKRLAGYLKPYRWQFCLALMAMVVFGATDGAVPFLVKYILDGVFADKNPELLYALPVALIGFALLRGFMDFGQQYLSSRIGHLIVRDLRNDLQRRLLALSGDFYLVHSSGNLLARITSDVMLVRTLLTDALTSVLRDSIRVVALLGTALLLDPTLAAIAFIGFPLGFYPIYRFGRRMRKLSRRGQEVLGKLSSVLQESILGHKVVKAFSREEFEKRRFEAKNDELSNTLIKSEKVRALTGPVNEVLATLAIAGVVLYGGLSVMEGVRTQGDFIGFLLSVFLLYDPFKKLSRVNATVQQGFSGAERLFEVLDTEPSVKEPANPVALGASNSISFEHVNFSYGDSEQLVLSDINIEIRQGEKVALVGLSGAGKSTMVDLIPRFIDPKSGRVTLGGVDVSTVGLKGLRERIAVVGQHTFLFNDTIFNNIAYGRETATPEEVQAAARAAYAYDFITKTERGFDTVVGEGGFALSGGQRQRIAIARAILKDAPVLILDEATASLDNKSEREVQAALEHLMQGRTCLIIAHRLSTVRGVDRILVMREGRIVEVGGHDELLARGGEYAKLYELQFATTRLPGEGGPLGETAIN